MVTEYLRKGSLDHFLKENKTLTPFQLIQMALQVASGMRYLEHVGSFKKLILHIRITLFMETWHFEIYW